MESVWVGGRWVVMLCEACPMAEKGAQGKQGEAGERAVCLCVGGGMRMA